jgi:hypothetical protein
MSYKKQWTFWAVEVLALSALLYATGRFTASAWLHATTAPANRLFQSCQTFVATNVLDTGARIYNIRNVLQDQREHAICCDEDRCFQ